ncbi:Nucleoside diphosphate kinase protein [Oopsacas minuta]|uniref:Nucleoside diphosphate kinase n=1 Tax=Oopsacas minuta TaxID=111878 RepID=A0AAV7JEA1_9METZ|nr:Nucleoside diphosphate kinase protein [Oopsacas minuta]
MGMEEVQHSPYSPNIAPCDLYLFRKLKDHISGHDIEYRVSLRRAIYHYLTDIPKEEYKMTFENWIKRLNSVECDVLLKRHLSVDMCKTRSVYDCGLYKLESKPGTIRGDYCIDIGRNICHGSDSVESAEKEIALWFKPDELVNWEASNHCHIYEPKPKPKQ